MGDTSTFTVAQAPRRPPPPIGPLHVCRSHIRALRHICPRWAHHTRSRRACLDCAGPFPPVGTAAGFPDACAPRPDAPRPALLPVRVRRRARVRAWCAPGPAIALPWKRHTVRGRVVRRPALSRPHSARVHHARATAAAAAAFGTAIPNWTSIAARQSPPKAYKATAAVASSTDSQSASVPSTASGALARGCLRL